MDVPRETKDRLQEYRDLVFAWNQKINLTGAKTAEEFEKKQINDCLNALKVLPNHPLWIDVGSGAGLPGIVWAILRPQEKFVLVESLNKRVSFLQVCQSTLHLPNIEIISSRFESLTSDVIETWNYLEPICVSRGTADAKVILKLANKTPLVFKQWIVFSTPNSHQKYLEEAVSGKKLRVSQKNYVREGNNEGVLTLIDPKNRIQEIKSCSDH